MKYVGAFLAIVLAAYITAAQTPPATQPSSGASPVPRPSVVSPSWELNFEYQTPQMIEVAPPGEAKARVFWYMLYTVTNETGREQIFVPELVRYSDTGKVSRAGEKVPAAVFAAVQSRHNNPLLKDQPAMTGKLLQGEDNAKDGVAIWPDLDEQAQGFDIFVGGLSGETEKIKLPTPTTVTVIDEEGNRKQAVKDEAIVSKTLRLAYKLPGEYAARARTQPKLEKKEWVMR